MKRTFLTAAALLCLAACKKPQPPVEPVPQPKAGEPAAAAQAAPAQGQPSRPGGALNAPGDYMRGMAGHVKAAKDAVALSNKQAEERMAQDPSQPSGN